MKVLLTGIGGSIGIHMFCHLMRFTDWEVIGVDSFRHKGLTDRLGYVLHQHPAWERRLTMVSHDLTAPMSYMSRKKVGGIDGVFNFASITDVADSIEQPAVALFNNTGLMLNLLEWLRKEVYIKFIVHVSSDEVYGPTTSDMRHFEWAPIVPSNPYSASKAMQEAMAIAYWRTYKLPLIIVNIANNFAPMQNPAKFPCIAIRNLSAGRPVPIHVHQEDGSIQVEGSRYYLHSHNTADAILFIARLHQEPYLHRDGLADLPIRYNITDEVKMTPTELAKTIAGLMDVAFEPKYIDVHKVRPGHDLDYGLNGGKLAAVGWVPPVEFTESLDQFVWWYKRHPEWLNPK